MQAVPKANLNTTVKLGTKIIIPECTDCWEDQFQFSRGIFMLLQAFRVPEEKLRHALRLDLSALNSVYNSARVGDSPRKGIPTSGFLGTVPVNLGSLMLVYEYISLLS